MPVSAHKRTTKKNDSPVRALAGEYHLAPKEIATLLAVRPESVSRFLNAKIGQGNRTERHLRLLESFCNACKSVRIESDVIGPFLAMVAGILDADLHGSSRFDTLVALENTYDDYFKRLRIPARRSDRPRINYLVFCNTCVNHKYGFQTTNVTEDKPLSIMSGVETQTSASQGQSVEVDKSWDIPISDEVAKELTELKASLLIADQPTEVDGGFMIRLTRRQR